MASDGDCETKGVLEPVLLHVEAKTDDPHQDAPATTKTPDLSPRRQRLVDSASDLAELSAFDTRKHDASEADDEAMVLDAQESEAAEENDLPDDAKNGQALQKGYFLLKVERTFLFMQLLYLALSARLGANIPTWVMSFRAFAKGFYLHVPRLVLWQSATLLRRISNVDLEFFKSLVMYFSQLGIIIVLLVLLFYFWVPADFTDPKVFDQWERRFVRRWFSMTVPITLAVVATVEIAVVLGSLSASTLITRNAALGIVVVFSVAFGLVAVLFLLGVTLIRWRFVVFTTYNAEYTRVLFLKGLSTAKVRIVLAILSSMYLPTAMLVLGALSPLTDWNDSSTTASRGERNYHYPCYFDSFPPVHKSPSSFVRHVGNTTELVKRTLPVVECHTSTALVTQGLSYLALTALIVGIPALEYYILNNTLADFYASEFYQNWHHAAAREARLRRELQAGKFRFGRARYALSLLRRDANDVYHGARTVLSHVARKSFKVGVAPWQALYGTCRAVVDQNRSKKKGSRRKPSSAIEPANAEAAPMSSDPKSSPLGLLKHLKLFGFFRRQNGTSAKEMDRDQRWRYRRSFEGKMDAQRRHYCVNCAEYVFALEEYEKDHSLLLSRWDTVLDSGAYAYLARDFVPEAAYWRLVDFGELASIALVLIILRRSASPESQLAALSAILILKLLITYAWRPFLYSRDTFYDAAGRMLIVLMLWLTAAFESGSLGHDAYLILATGLFVLFVLLLIYVFEIAERGFLMYRKLQKSLDGRVITLLFGTINDRSLVLETSHAGLPLLVQWDDLLYAQRWSALLAFPSPTPPQLLSFFEKLVLVKWATIRGLTVAKVRTDAGLNLLHHAFEKGDAPIVCWLADAAPRLLDEEDHQRDTPVVVGLKECASTLLKLSDSSTDQRFKLSNFAHSFLSPEVARQTLHWNRHHYAALQDISVPLLGELVQLLAEAANFQPPAGNARVSNWGKHSVDVCDYLAELYTSSRSRLFLQDKELGDLGIQALLSLLRALRLRRTTWTRKSAFRAGYPINVRSVDLSKNRLSAKVGPPLAKMLQENATLISLKLDHNGLEDSAGVALAEALRHHPALTAVDLSFNLLGPEAGKAIVSMLKRNAQLKFLDLRSNRLGPYRYWADRYTGSCEAGCGAAFGDCLRLNKTLTTLLLGQNALAEDTGRAFGAGLKRNKTLTHLDLSGNELGSDGVCEIALALARNSAITHLDIGGNQAGPKAAKLLASALRGRGATLKCLDLSQNAITTPGAESLLLAIRENASLTRVSLRENDLGPNSLKVLSRALLENRTLQHIDLSKNDNLGRSSHSGGDATGVGAELRLALTHNDTLATLDLWGSDMETREVKSMTTGIAANSSLEVLRLRGIVVPDISAIQLAVLALRFAREMDLTSCRMSPLPCAAFADAIKGARCLRNLSLSHNHVGERGASNLADFVSAQSCGLERLELQGADLDGDAGVRLFQALAENSSLTHLDVSDNKMSVAAGFELADSVRSVVEGGVLKRRCCIRSFIADNCNLGADVGEALLANLMNTVTEVVRVGGNPMGPRAGEVVGSALRKGYVAWRELNVESSGLGRDGLNSIFWALRRNTALRSLDLSGNEAGPVFGTAEDDVEEHGNSLASALRLNVTLQWLDLGNNGLSAECGKRFAEGLCSNPSICSLFMEENNLDDDAGIAIAEKIAHNDHLQSINIHSNKLGPRAGRAIGESLKYNEYLQELNIAHNRIGWDEGVGQIFSRSLMKNKALQYLNLEDNRFAPSEMLEVVHSLKHNNAMKHLNIRNNRLDDDVGVALLEMLKINTTIIQIEVSEEEIGLDAAGEIRGILTRRI